MDNADFYPKVTGNWLKLRAGLRSLTSAD